MLAESAAAASTRLVRRENVPAIHAEALQWPHRNTRTCRRVRPPGSRASKTVHIHAGQLARGEVLRQATGVYEASRRSAHSGRGDRRGSGRSRTTQRSQERLLLQRCPADSRPCAETDPWSKCEGGKRAAPSGKDKRRRVARWKRSGFGWPAVQGTQQNNEEENERLKRAFKQRRSRHLSCGCRHLIQRRRWSGGFFVQQGAHAPQCSNPTLIELNLLHRAGRSADLHFRSYRPLTGSVVTSR